MKLENKGQEKNRYLQEFEKLINLVGFKRPTTLQRLIIPSIMAKRDVIVEAGSRPGKSLSIAASIIMRSPKPKSRYSVLILTRDISLVRRLQRLLTIKYASFLNGFKLCILGFTDLLKKEVRQLAERPEILISTPSRLIDHLRRENLALAETEIVYIDEPENPEPFFENDICYILSKLNMHCQIVYFSFRSFQQYKNLPQLIKRPLLIRESDFKESSLLVKFYYFAEQDLENLLTRLLAIEQYEAGLILVTDFKQGKNLWQALNHASFKVELLPDTLSKAKAERRVALNLKNLPTLFIASKDCLPFLNLNNFSHIFFYTANSFDNQFGKMKNILIEAAELKFGYFLIEPAFESQLINQVKALGLNIEKRVIPKEEDALKALLLKLYKKADSESSLNDNKEIYRIIKKIIPLGKRTYFLANLLYKYLKNFITRGIKFLTLFLSMGNTHGFSQQDLKELLVNKCGLANSFVREIRIFNNYTFFEVAAEYAPKVIEKLNGLEIKGKKLIVNYSTKAKMENKDFGNNAFKKN